jgi:glycosyltransferase involved in cell wall biosynthesis
LSDTPKPWVTVFSPTLTGNALFRTHTVVGLLRERFSVQLIGFGRASEIYLPLAANDRTKPDVAYYAKNIISWWWNVRRMSQLVKGDVLVAVKPLLGSFGAALVLGRQLRRPVVLDNDDWEPGFLSSAPYWEARTWGLKWFTATDSPLHTRLLDAFAYRANAVTVSNSFLQALYGGHWIPHVRDSTAFRPSSNPVDVRRKTVLFGGAPRGHKGLPALLRAWKGLGRTDAILRLAVPDPDDAFLRNLRPLDVPNVVVTGPHSFEEMPSILADAAIVVVPQENARGSVGQLPAKLMDAMAAAKPIVATDVCDAARWLGDGAGIVVTPGSDRALMAGLQQALDHPEMWDEMGAKARSRLMMFASERLLARRFCDVVSSVLQKRPLKEVPAFEVAPDDPDT